MGGGPVIPDEAVEAFLRARAAKRITEIRGALDAYIDSARKAPMWESTRAGLEAAAPLIGCGTALIPGDRCEWGVRWHGADVRHGHGADGQPLYDEQGARAVAIQFANAVAVYRIVAGPWIDAP